jgi:hypothetical protein
MHDMLDFQEKMLGDAWRSVCEMPVKCLRRGKEMLRCLSLLLGMHQTRSNSE